MSYYEALAKVIYDHVHSARGNPSAPWDKQSALTKAPYLRAAQVTTIMLHPHNKFVVSMQNFPPETVADVHGTRGASGQHSSQPDETAD